MIPTLTACIITYNEEDNIARCLESLDFVEEIILLDSGSKDKTTEIASNFSKVKIHTRAFDNYVSQKNFCLSLSKNNWIIFLDADEVISPELKKEILSIPDFNWDYFSGFEIPRLTFYLNKWIHHGGWYPNYQLKLFNKSKGYFTGLLVHEKVKLEGESKKLKSPLFHYSYKNISDHLKFIDRYSSLAAEEKFNKGKKSGIILSVGKSFYKFIYMYFVKFGILDGKAGLVIAILGSYYNFLKYIKIYELSIYKEKKSGNR
ncbi:MAG: glycosyltransferase family 2 protein [Leptospiraceae bacterium]|nr:glycosyltransferase family 2 protein [Leptospiraceae bacterium]